MTEIKARERTTIPEEVMLGRLAQSEQMRDFCIQMWRQNPLLAKQGGPKVQSLLTPLECGAVHVPSGKGINKQRGISLIELIMFIVIIGIALAGILQVMSMVTRHSADPLVHKQALAIAESLLEEVELMPFTFCDPDDLNAASATAAVVGGAGCAATVEGIGPETIAGVTETRNGGAGVNTQFDNVSDYDAVPLVPGAVVDINGNPAPPGYTATVAVGAPPLALGTVPVAETLLITVTVTGPDNIPIVLQGYRTRYAPRSVP